MRDASKRELAALMLAGAAWFAIMLACSNPEQEEQSVVEVQPELTVSAARLYGDYEANEVAADARYKNRILRVSGTVDSIGKDITDTMYVVLKSDEYSAFGVQCMFAGAHESELAQLQKGQFLTVKGKCDGKLLSIILRGCVLEGTGRRPRRHAPAALPTDTD